MESNTDSSYRRIGQGFCGTVWAAKEGLVALKREDGGPGRSIENDFLMHKRSLEALQACQSRVTVTECHQYVHRDDLTRWAEQLPRFPKDFQQRCNVLVTQRIQPFGKTVRETIINLYCPESLKSVIKESDPDQDCLIRPYLGRRRQLEKKSKFHAFSLRNYGLHADQIEELALDSTAYAQVMAETLAILYWKAHVDANDVEFVLAPPSSGGGTSLHSPSLGEHVVWILDYDCCRHMDLSKGGVQQAVSAFYRNDPYYPRPGCCNETDQRLWTEFRDRFLDLSGSMLEKGSPEAALPMLWVNLVEERQKSLSRNRNYGRS